MNGIKDNALNQKAQNFFVRIDRKEVFSQNEAEEFLSCLIDIGRIKHYKTANIEMDCLDFYINDQVIAELLILAIEDASDNLASYALSNAAFLRHVDIDRYVGRMVAVNLRLEKIDKDIWCWYYYPKDSWDIFTSLKQKFQTLYNDNSDDLSLLGNLAGLGDAKAQHKLLNILNNCQEDFYTRTVAIEILGRLGGKDSIRALLEAMNDNTMLEGSTLRKFILPELARNYPENTAPFIEYFLDPSRYYTNEESYAANIKMLYAEICKWSKVKLNYQLDLEKADLEIYDLSKGIKKYPMKKKRQVPRKT